MLKPGILKRDGSAVLRLQGHRAFAAGNRMQQVEAHFIADEAGLRQCFLLEGNEHAVASFQEIPPAAVAASPLESLLRNDEGGKEWGEGFG